MRLPSLTTPLRQRAAQFDTVLDHEFMRGERLGTALAVALGVVVVAGFALLMGTV